MGNGERLAVPETAKRMAGAASAFLAALTAGQRERACFAFGSERDERRDWSFLPAPDRNGLPIGALDDGQRRLAHELIVTGTSLPGYTKVVSVMAMEHVLRTLAPDGWPIFLIPNGTASRCSVRREMRPGDGSSPGTTCRSTSPWSTAGTSPPRPACWGPSLLRSGCSRRWPTTRNSATGWSTRSTPPSGAPPSSTTGRRPTWPPGWCPGWVRRSGRMRCSRPSRTT